LEELLEEEEDELSKRNELLIFFALAVADEISLSGLSPAWRL